ncbi:hypothetical protein Niako_0626 [Niastella koreensis GR20-10]|uniref:Uncharacterized protein n=1 Tax=Niastella koreensis (strain DSM 17620 / KACC 11465 / NBRC 106392 / GR20-10) TaxID=700598 RepID=G8T959_NIAKG|nr:hypothetical protein Niako_0626 [Niastella koreensis GR20-10]
MIISPKNIAHTLNSGSADAKGLQQRGYRLVASFLLETLP